MNTLLYEDIKENINSYHPIIRDSWIIKFSNYKGNILMFVGSLPTGEMLTKYFSNEDLAVKYINWLLSQDPYLPIEYKKRMPKNHLTKKQK